ncbi:MAG: hypothetical protein P0Y49_13545 [Candidatus Pedobacter colombiensis]|uniref:DUF4595 domain-containing protein n=1 Tax=Candidatus Pedobacter colombiensis TaxID=3121371 RepID=A0AAJ6B790_9SPHI|nr:hypothetical protein [Pedobacter sp.]WEK17823.1 MAG: hypothetical protein P0Y49_13545 [Pedobacter sp.]
MSCKKGSTPAPVVPTPGNKATGCLITKSSTAPTTRYEYNYTNNKMTSIVGYYTLLFPEFWSTINYTSAGAIGSVVQEIGSKSEFYRPDSYTYNFPNGFFNPMVETTTHVTGGAIKDNPVGTVINQAKYNIVIGDQNRPSYIKEVYKDIEMKIYYDDKFNATQVTYEPLTGVRGKTTIVATYDDKPNAYVDVPDWKWIVMMDWMNPDYVVMLTALSQSNPLTISLISTTVLPGSVDYVLNYKITYTYNDKGLPLTSSTTMTQSTSNYAPYVYQGTFQYTCK